MKEHCHPCGSFGESINLCNCVQIPTCPPFPVPLKSKVCSRCNNSVQNPSFEADLTSWEYDNVSIASGNTFEGTQVANIGPGVASLFQDVSLDKLFNSPLFLSFNVIAASETTFNGNLVVEVLWLDAGHNVIATGLRLFIPSGRINANARITYTDITDRPPANAVWARLLFSKGSGESSDIIALDQVILTPVLTINLVQNPGFELGLTDWTTTTFTINNSYALEGTAQAFVSGGVSTLLQDVPIRNLPRYSSFLFSFGAVSGNTATLIAQIFWLDAQDNQIGPPGLTISIPPDTLVTQINYLTYLDITGPAPAGAVKARIQFTTDSVQSLSIDEVILARAAVTNLVQNAGFEDSLNNWAAVNAFAATSNNAYEGSWVARIGGDGGSLFQDVPIVRATGHCFIFNFGVGYSSREFGNFSGNLLAQVHWLDQYGRGIGIGVSLVIPGFALQNSQWMVYNAITEPAPPGAVTARIQFAKSSSTDGILDIDKVVLGRLV